jgi:hypothetical protein
MRAEHGEAEVGLPATLRFLIAASRDPSLAANVDMSPDDWQRLPEAAHRHGLSAVLPAALTARPDVPPHLRDEVADLERARAVAALRGMAEAVMLSSALEAAGVPCVVLKGPAFSEWLYGDMAFRRFSDIDLLVAPATRDTAYETLRGLGCSLPGTMSSRTACVIYGDLGAWPLSKPGALPVDLHWRLAQRRFAAPLEASDVLAAARPLSEKRRDIRVPSPTHAAVLTLLHAAKHLWCTLELVSSIARLTARHDIDWQAVFSLLQRSGGLRGAGAGLALAEELFDARLPGPFAEAKSRDASGALRAAAIAALLEPAGEFPDRWRERRAHREALDRWSDRLRYDAWRLAAPTPLEWAWWPLPDGLAGLYSPLRFVRLGVSAARHLLSPAGEPAQRKSIGARSAR